MHRQEWLCHNGGAAVDFERGLIHMKNAIVSIALLGTVVLA
jgi:hypothetical protein